VSSSIGGGIVKRIHSPSINMAAEETESMSRKTATTRYSGWNINNGEGMQDTERGFPVPELSSGHLSRMDRALFLRVLSLRGPTLQVPTVPTYSCPNE
jgi:hypothetical protein